MTSSVPSSPSVSSAISPVPSVSPSVSSQILTVPKTTRPRYSPVNPLVAAGLNPEDRSGILATSPEDAAVTMKTKRITKARNQTSDEYSEMLRVSERKKKEAEELQKNKKAEREQRKKEREENNKEAEEKKKQKATRVTKSGARCRVRMESSHSEDGDVGSEFDKLETISVACPRHAKSVQFFRRIPKIHSSDEDHMASESHSS